MNILTIGGTGNISTEVTSALFTQGHTITTVTSGTRPVPQEYHAITVNRNDVKAFKKVLNEQKPDVVIDFIAYTPDECQVDYEIFNSKISQFIFISTAAVYEKPHRRFPITETTPLSNPFWSYAQQKIACEEYLSSVHSTSFPVTIIRPSHTFGNKRIPFITDSHNFTIAKRILDNKQVILHDRGESLWTLTAASDFAIGLAGLVGNNDALGESFHITSDESLTWNEIYEYIGISLGKKTLIEYMPSEFIAKKNPKTYGMLFGDKKEHGVFDNQKIKRFVPGFECQKSILQAITESVNWYLEDSTRQIIDPVADHTIDKLIVSWRRHHAAVPV